MATYQPELVLPNGQPGQWGEPVSITYDTRDVLLYAVGIGIENLSYVYEDNQDFAVFPTFPIRWGGAGAPIDLDAIPNSPGPLNIDAERYLEMLKPLPTSGEVTVRSRVIAAHPRGKGNGFVEFESTVSDNNGDVCVKMVNGSFRRGVQALGDIESFPGIGQTFSAKIEVPDRDADVITSAVIASNQGHIYRLSGTITRCILILNRRNLGALTNRYCMDCVHLVIVDSCCWNHLPKVTQAASAKSK